MNALVTGGSGFLGAALVRRLVAGGVRVRALSRRVDSDERLAALGAERLRGDLERPLDPATRWAEQGDVIFHAAARVELSGRWEDFVRGTVGATRRLLDAVLPSRPARFLYFSSGSVYSEKSTGPLSAQSVEAAPDGFNLYGRAKLAAEGLVRERCESAGVAWTILRLPFLYGPGNEMVLRRMTKPLQRGRAFIVGPGENRLATVYVGDAAEAAFLAAWAPIAASRIYDVASDEAVTQKRFLALTAQALGCAPPRRHIARALAMALMRVLEPWALRRGRIPKYSRALVALMASDQVIDASRIRQELGWRPAVSFDEGMRRFAQWVAQRQAETAIHAAAAEVA